MRSIIKEDDIEQSLLNRLQEIGWHRIECNPAVEQQDEVATTGRANSSECVLPEILRGSLKRINPGIDSEIIDSIVDDLRKDFTGTDIVDTNYNLYNQIRNGIKIDTRNGDENDFVIVKLIDFDNVDNNDFTAVNQMWVKGRFGYRRPDVLLFVNGLPLVFIELKNSTVKVEEAYNKNLLSYRKDIPNLFALNQICVISNGLTTKLGAFNAGYEFFFEWLRVDGEKETVNRERIAEEGSSILYLINGLFRKDRLIDYIENFVFFDNKKIKIIAKNHQYLGVNNLMKNVERRDELGGKLGVFWHTQGSGKSYSMVMFVRKVRRKVVGNFTFLVVTDRKDLDDQIYKTFSRAEVISAKEECQPKNSEQLREFLKSNKPMLFTLINKFGYDKKEKYPLLSERDDIFVLVDEAHRTQYKQLAENMRAGIPNAKYVAFTGTPLFGSKNLTENWFGGTVSEYNFRQAVEDGSTVPLYYSRRVPEVGLKNDWLDTDIDQIVEDEDLNDRERQLLENSASKILEVIKRDDRLDKVAQDIAHHFPRRGFLGKGMVVSVDKYTAVKMYDKVQHYWKEEKKNLTEERNKEQDPKKREELTKRLSYMDGVEMAVVVSEEADEVQKFKAQGLDITIHRNKMNDITTEGMDIEDRFKDKDDKLQLVFVCAMWLTGFDVPSLSTLYLDKPMKNHTLMQAIARANRVFPGKQCGLIIDYVNVFEYMQRAFSEYASGGDGSDFPAKDIKQLINNIDKCIAEIDAFLKTIEIDIDTILETTDAIEQIEMYRKAYNRVLEKDEWKDRFKVLTNLLGNLYEASKPEIIEKRWYNEKYAAIMYLSALFYNQIDDEKIAKARARMSEVLDRSVSSAEAESKEGYVIHHEDIIDLTNLDVEHVRKTIKEVDYKAVEVEDLRKYIEKVLVQMINKNITRIKFSERYRSIIDRYNAGGSENEDYYNQLLKLIEELRTEQSRSATMGLTEEELEIYDLLIKDKKLTKEEEQRVKLAAKNLYKKIMEEKDNVMVVDWYKDSQPKQRVLTLIRNSLNYDLPESYDRDIFNAKTDLLLNHFIDMAVQGYGWVS